MEITPELITYLEVLGRIHLTEDEKIRTQKDLASILGYIDQLNRLDTENVEPLAHTFSVTNAFREDVITNGDARGDILSNAPAQKDGCFKVPKTVE